DALYQYALLQTERLGKPKKAIKYFKKALIENPGHPFANYDLALVYHQLGNKAKAWSAYQAAIAINPELKTPENDLVFTKPEPKVVKPKPVVTNEPVLGAVAEEVESEIDTIAALKNNIQQLEQLLTARLQEKEKPEPEVVETIIDPASIKTVFITGATSGIGKATAIEFAKNGHRLIINGRRVERLDAFKAELEESYNIEVLTLPFDVRDMEAVNGAVDSLEGVWGEIDILLNNAGKAKGLAPIHEGEMVHWEEMIDTNLKGILYLTRAVAPMMTTRHKGHIINISSSAGKEVYPNGNVYCATKHAVEALTKAMRIDLHKHNIRVSQVSPGHVEETEFALVRFDGDAEKAKIYNDFNPLTSKDVAEAIYFIATRPAHVNIQDVVMFGTQQASATIVDRSGRYEEEE
ncbi:MAG: SDR family NAD(P)-dependent oxidoreductase, partial [Bacteroidota bacterium]